MLTKDQKKLVSTGLFVVIGCVIAWFLLVDRQPPRQETRQLHQRPRPAPAPPQAQPENEEADQNTSAPGLDPIYVAIAPLPRPQPATRPALAQPEQMDLPADVLAQLEALLQEEQATPQPVIPVEVARHALAFVGADPQAEEIWVAAINDPNLAADIRRDLIEDLNQDGFDDPGNITPADLPLIYSRLALIEELAPEAMDETNAAAFAEAYNDLVNLVIRLARE